MAEPLFREGNIMFVSFDAFTVRLTFGSGASLDIAVVAGENEGFEDTVAYEAVAINSDILVLSWRETIGSTIVHVMNRSKSTTYAVITPAEGGFLRLEGEVAGLQKT